MASIRVKYVGFIVISYVSVACINVLNANTIGDGRRSKDYVENGRENMLDKRPLICDHFHPLNCLQLDSNKCHVNKTCTRKDQFCFTSWTKASTDYYVKSNKRYGKSQHPSEYTVKAMGCIASDQSVHKCEASCEQKTKLTGKHGQFFCCCSGKNELLD